MKNLKQIFLLVSLSLVLTSCAGNSGTRSGVSQGGSISYTEYKDVIPTSVDNSVKTSKKGTACTTNILGLFAIGNSSIEKAMQDADITKVAFVDTTYRSFSFYIPFFQEGCTVVVGQ